jgi:ABC-2 type transport system permease protein
MTLQIILHELRLLVRTSAFLWLSLLLAAAILFGAWSATSVFQRETRGAAAMAATSDNFRAKMRGNLAQYETKVGGDARKMGVAVFSHNEGEGPPQATNAGAMGRELNSVAVLPPTGLAALSVGQNDLRLTYLPVSMRSLTHVTKDGELSNPVDLKRGAFDVAFVLVFLLPIIILAISYDLLSSEKERGTLVMVLSHPVSLKRLMTCKLLSRSMIVLAIVVLATLVAILAVGHDLGRVDTWTRVVLWLGGVVLYGVFWLAVAAFVNLRGRSSSTNAMILAVTWLAVVVVIPTLVSLVATTLYPAPSRFEFIVAARDAQTRAEANYMKELDKYYFDHLEYVPGGEDKVNDFLSVSIAKENAIQREVQPLYDRFRAQLSRQEQAVGWAQFLSPAIMLQRVLNEAAGTDTGRYTRFLDQVFAFHRTWSEFFSTRFLKRQPMTTADFDAIPRFQFVEEATAAPVSRAVPSLLGLVALTGLVFLGISALLRRYQPAAR